MNACELKVKFKCAGRCDFWQQGYPVDWIDTYKNCIYFDCGNCKNIQANNKAIVEFIESYIMLKTIEEFDNE